MAEKKVVTVIVPPGTEVEYEEVPGCCEPQMFVGCVEVEKAPCPETEEKKEGGGEAVA